MKNRLSELFLILFLLTAVALGGLLAQHSPQPTISAQSDQTEYTLQEVFAAWLFSTRICETHGENRDIGFVDVEECRYVPPDWFQPIITPVPTEVPFDTPAPDNTNPPEPNTPTPLPEVKTCTIVNNLTTAINMRSEPQVADNKVGSWQPGVPLNASEFYVAGLFRWAKVGVAAWVAIYQDQWWITSNDCTQVKGWNASWTNPPPIVTATETLSGAHASAPINFLTQQAICGLANVKIVKAITLAGDLLRIIKQCRPDIITIYRVTDPECPSPGEDPILYADRWLSAVKHYGPDPSFVDYYEMMNECAVFQGSEDYRWLAQFFIAFTRYVNSKEGMCILVGGFGPGNPLVSDFVELYLFFKYAEENPCGRWPDGRLKYHGVSEHSSVCPPFSTPDYPWNCWEWIFGRHLKYNASLMGRWGYDLLGGPLPFMITEAGIVYGFAEEDPFTPQQKKLAVMNSLCLWQQDGVDGFAWWNICGGDNCWGWLNDSDNLSTMFSWTQQEYDALKNSGQICVYP